MDNFDALDTSSTIPAAPDASIPAPVSEAPPDFNPFADDKGVQTLSQGTTPLLERMRLHFKQGQTKETPFGAASHYQNTGIERAARSRGNPSDLENEAIDRAVKTRDDLAAYDRMPGAEGFLDYGAAIVGHLAGNVADPTSAIGNVVKIPYLAGKGIVTTLGKFGIGEGAAGVAGRMAEFGVNQAIINTATDPVVQGINIATKDGTRDSYDPFQTFVESPIGGFVGGALLKGAHEAGSALFVRPQVEKDALFFLRMLRDQAGVEEQKRWPDMTDAVKGKTDKELGDMAKEIATDDKAAGDKAKEPAKPAEPPPLPETETAKPAEPTVAPEAKPAEPTVAPEAKPVEPFDPITPDPKPEPGFVVTPIDDASLIGARAPRMPAHRVTDASGRSVDVAPVIVEAADLKASNDAGYAPELQPRDRDRAASQAQVTNISTRLDPERLGQSPEASHGAPIVGPDGMVESGNGRVMAIRDAYKQNGDSAQRYRDWLTKQGVDVSQYKEPVLVRQRVTELTPEERQAFTIAANQSTLLSMSAPERALADARNISINDLGLIEVPNDLGAAGNLGFVRSFISKLPQSEQGALMDAKGRLSQEGLIRVRNAIMARAYGDSPILIRIAEATNDDVKSISNALQAVAPHWARLRGDVDAGYVRADMDITQELVDAVTRTADLRNAGTKLDEFLAQADALDPLDENVEWLMKLFYNESGRRAASTDNMVKGLKYYTEQAGKVEADAGLDLGMTPVKSRDIVRAAAEKAFEDERARAQAKSEKTGGDLFGGGAGDGKGDATVGGGEPRPNDGGGREGVREPGAGSDQGGQQRAGTETGEAGPTEREVANGLTYERAHELAREAQAREDADVLSVFDGDKKKAAEYDRLFRRMMSDSDDAAAEKARTALFKLTQDLSPEKLAALEKEYPEEQTASWWRSVADTISQHTSHNADELASNLAHALIDTPQHSDWARMTSREKLAVVAANKVLADANTLGVDMRDVLKKLPAKVRERYGDPQDAGFMLDNIRKSLEGQQAKAPDPTLPPPAGGVRWDEVTSPDQIVPGQYVELGKMYRGTEGGNVDAVLRVTVDGDLGKGIYVTQHEKLAASYGGGPSAKISDASRVVHSFNVDQPIAPTDVAYAFGSSTGGQVKIVRGTGEVIFDGKWDAGRGSKDATNVETALEASGVKVVIGAKGGFLHNQVSIRDPSILADRRVGMDVSTPDYRASRAMDNALDKIEEAVEVGDRKAVATAAKEAKKVLADTPQSIKDLEPEYWGQFDSLIKKMSRKGYVTGKQQAEADAIKAHGDAMPGIGDTLAAHAESGGDAPLDVAIRPMQFSNSRAPEASHVPSAVPIEAPNIRQLWADVARELGATVRAGRMVGKTAAGQYFLRSGVIRMRQFDDPTVLIHEIGHHVEDKFGKPLQDIIFSRANSSLFGGMELDNMTRYAQSHKDPLIRRKEGFAEFFRLLIENPAEAQARAPNFLADFDRFLNEQGLPKEQGRGRQDMRATIEKAQRAFDAYRLANAEDIVDANIHTSVETKGWAKVREDVRNDGFWNTITDRGSRVYTGLFDENNTLAVTVRNLLKIQKDNTGKIISLIAADDSAKLIRLASNAHQSGMIDMMHGVTPYRSNAPEGPSIFDAIALATGKPNILSGWDDKAVNSFAGYLVALRGVFEWERRAAGLLTKDPMPLPKDMFETKIRVYEQRNPNARAAADMVHEWTRNLLKKEYEAGLITGDAYDAALQVRDYVPLMRDMSDKSNTGGGGEFDAATVGIRRFKGSARPIISPLESLMERSFRTAQLIAHNDAIAALGNLADKAGVGAGQWVERIPASEIKARFVDPLEALRKGLADNGASKVDADLAISQMLNDLRIDENDMGPVAIFRSKQAAERGENIVFYLSGGEMKALRLKEGKFGKELIMNLTGGLTPQLRDLNLQAMGHLSSLLRLGVTTSPDFFISNMIRDQMATWILNRGTLPLFDSFRGIYREITNSELSRTFAQMGGIAGGANVNAIDHARIDKDIQALAAKGFTIARFANWEGVFKLVELSETASRVGLFEVSYKRALKQGLSPYEASVEAAFQANDNLDFGRHGSRMGNTIKLIPFLNANMQGIDKAIRTLFSPAFKEKLTTQDAEAVKTMYSAWAKIATLTGLSMALRANYIDDPEYQELSPYLRNMNWMVRIPGAKDNKIVDMFGRTIEVPDGLQSLWLAIPKPFELAIPFNLGERAVEMLNDKNPKALSQWAWGALDLVAGKTMMSSVGIKVAAEMKSGKDFFTNRDIVPEHLQGLEPWAQASAGTSSLAKSIGEAADRVNRATGLGPDGGLSPMYIDQFIKGVAGTQGRNLLSLTDAAIGTKGDQSLADKAIARRWWKESYRGSTSTTEFWDQVADKTGGLAQAANTYDKLLSNPAAAAAYVARLPEDKRAFVIMSKSDFPGDEKQLHPLVNAHKAMTAISNMKREIADQTLSSAASLEPIKLSPSEQRVALDALSRIQMWTARNSLIASGTAALKGQNPAAIDADMEALQSTVPSVYEELSQRYANAKVYKAASVAEHWDEVKQSVIDEGSATKLSGIAHEVQRDGFELDGRRDKKKKVRPVVPGALETVN